MPNDWKQSAIRDLEETDLSYQEIGAKYGRHRDTIIKLKRSEGIVRKKAVRKTGPNKAADMKQISLAHRALGVRLTLYRGIRNRSDLAKELNVSRYVVSMMEIGTHDFKLSELLKISSVLGLSITEMIEPHRVQPHGR